MSLTGQCADTEGGGGGGGGGTGVLTPWKITKVATSLLSTGTEKHWDPLGPIVSRGRSVRPSVKYVDD